MYSHWYYSSNKFAICHAALVNVHKLHASWNVILTCEGVSVSLIGWPSNRNRICLIDSPWEGGQKKTEICKTKLFKDNKLTRGHQCNRWKKMVSPVVHNKLSWVCWEECAFWSWIAPLSHPGLPPSGWCAHCSQSSLPPENNSLPTFKTFWSAARIIQLLDSHIFKNGILLEQNIFGVEW